MAGFKDSSPALGSPSIFCSSFSWSIPLHLSRPSRLEVLARELPFAVDDYDAAGDAYVRWLETRADGDLGVVQLWAYCYTIQYFYAKFARERTSGVSDLDAAISSAYDRILRSLLSVHTPGKFAHYVSVICRNVLQTHRSRRHETVELDEGTRPVMARGAQDHDRVLMRRVLNRAIGALPPAVREVAQMRFVEHRSYQDIAAATGRPLATVRTFVSKSKSRLRDDSDLRAVYSLGDGLGGSAPGVGPDDVV